MTLFRARNVILQGGISVLGPAVMSVPLEAREEFRVSPPVIPTWHEALNSAQGRPLILSGSPAHCEDDSSGRAPVITALPCWLCEATGLSRLVLN